MKKIVLVLIILVVMLSGCSYITGIGSSMDDEIEDWNNEELEKALSKIDDEIIDKWNEEELAKILSEMDDEEIEKWNQEQLEEALKDFEDDEIDNESEVDVEVDGKSEDDNGSNNNEGESTSLDDGIKDADKLQDLRAVYEGETIDPDGTTQIRFVLTIDGGSVLWETYFEGNLVFSSSEGVPLLSDETFDYVEGEQDTLNGEDVYFVDFSEEGDIVQIWYSIEYLIPIKFHNDMTDSEGRYITDYELVELEVGN